MRRLSLVLAALISTAALADGGQPHAAVVLLERKGLNQREAEAIIDAANDEMQNSSGYVIDKKASENAASEASLIECSLDAACLMRVSEQVHADAIVGMRATGNKKSIAFEILWVATDARGLPNEGKVDLARSPSAIEKGVRAGVRDVIPDYARRGVGGVIVLAEAGSEVLVDGQQVSKAPMNQPAIVSAGIHRIDVLTPKRLRVSKTFEVTEARKSTVDMPTPSAAIEALTAPEATEPMGKTLKTAGVVVGGVGAVSLLGGIYMAGQTGALNGQVRAGQCQAAPCGAGMTQVDADKLYQRAQGDAMLAQVGVGAGVLMGAAAAVMWWLGNREAGQ